MRISDWSSDVCSSDLPPATAGGGWEGVPTVRADSKDTPPQPVRPSSTARWRSSGREPMARKRPSLPPAFAGEGAKLAASAAPMRPDSAGGAFARLVHMRAEAGDEGAQSRLDGGVDDQSPAVEHLARAREERKRVVEGKSE